MKNAMNDIQLSKCEGGMCVGNCIWLYVWGCVNELSEQKMWVSVQMSVSEWQLSLWVNGKL